jgi:hypothetical protein
MANPISRQPQRFNRFDLSVATREFIRVKVPTAKAMTVAAFKESGSWSTRTLVVNRVVGPSSYGFATAKTIAAGGGSVSLSSIEMEGVTEIEIVTNTGAAEAAGSYATITITIESDATQPVTEEDRILSGGFEESTGGGFRVIGS